MRETLNEKLSKFRVNPFIPSPFPFSPCAALLFSSQPPPPSPARPPPLPARLPTTAAKPPPATLSQAATQHAAVAPNPQIGPNLILQQWGMNRRVTSVIQSHVVISSMESISDITNRWAKIFEIFLSNQDEEQKYVPPSKRSILPTPPLDQNLPSHLELINIVQTTSLEALLQQQFSKDS